MYNELDTEVLQTGVEIDFAKKMKSECKSRSVWKVETETEIDTKN